MTKCRWFPKISCCRRNRNRNRNQGSGIDSCEDETQIHSQITDGLSTIRGDSGMLIPVQNDIGNKQNKEENSNSFVSQK